MTTVLHVMTMPEADNLGKVTGFVQDARTKTSHGETNATDARSPKTANLEALLEEGGHRSVEASRVGIVEDPADLTTDEGQIEEVSAEVAQCVGHLTAVQVETDNDHIKWLLPIEAHKTAPSFD